MPVFIASSVDHSAIKTFAHCLRLAGCSTAKCCWMSDERYRQTSLKSGVMRIVLRLEMYVLYPLQLIWKSLQAPHESIFVVTTNTFYAPLIVLLAGSWKKLRVVHLLYDLYPDAIEVTGKMRYGGWRSLLVGIVTRAIQRKCSGTVYLGHFLKYHCERRWGASSKQAVIDVATDTHPYRLEDIQPPLARYKIRYGGQFGQMHDVDTVIACLKKAEKLTSISFHFFISGVGYEPLKQAFAGSAVEVSSIVKRPDWVSEFREYPLGLISLSPGGATVCLPSKIYNMLAGGQAILAICPLWSDLASIILASGSGWVINNSPYRTKDDLEAGDYLSRARELRDKEETAGEFFKVIQHLEKNPDEIQLKRKKAVCCARDVYSSKAIGEKWRTFLGSL